MVKLNDLRGAGGWIAPWVLLLVLAIAVARPATARAEEVFDCVIDPAKIIRIGSPVVGLLADVLVQRGDIVGKGEVVAQMDSAIEAATVALNKARVKNTAAIEAQRQRLELRKKTFERAEKLAKNDVISQQRIDVLEAEVQINEWELARELAENRLAELELARSQTMLDRRTIRSPEAGVVIERALNGGEFVHQEAHILTLAKLDPLYVEAFLPVRFYDKIRVGKLGILQPQEPVGGRHEARVTVVDRVFDAASGTFGVRLELPNPGNALPAGVRCQVSFAIEGES